jgi:Ca2+:H+ antiporter
MVYGIRRATSLPDRLNQQAGTVVGPLGPTLPYVTPVNVSRLSLDSKDNEVGKKNISKKTAIILLLVSTGLVALCAEFLVDSIDALVRDTGVSPAFVGLIILPIIGNAAEHVTAVTVAAKNKMDLAIGVALGSSIQIALFITPVIVLLGWILNKDMSLYFSLFETISLFVSAFIVNFLVLDGRSNYLEGALLCAAYIIIGLSSFFYPDSSQLSPLSGASDRIQ